MRGQGGGGREKGAGAEWWRLGAEASGWAVAAELCSPPRLTTKPSETAGGMSVVLGAPPLLKCPSARASRRKGGRWPDSSASLLPAGGGGRQCMASREQAMRRAGQQPAHPAGARSAHSRLPHL